MTRPARADRTKARLVIALLLLLTAILHRQAASNPWADDRLLAPEPSWFQMAAPLLHAAVPESPSLAHTVIRLIDPLTRASAAGDSRALAACAAGLSAALLLLLLERLHVPWRLAWVLPFAVAGSVLPVSTAVAASHAIQMLIGAALLLVACAPPASRFGRLVLLVVLTLGGAITHASFLAFASVIWLTLVWQSRDAAMLITGLVTLAAGLLIDAGLLHLSAVASMPPGVLSDIPGAIAMAAALVTGRFADGLQPSGGMGLLAASAHVLPQPAVLVLLLSLLAWMNRESRRAAWTIGAACAALWIFVAGTWLPDPRVAAAPARLGVIALAALGATWIARQSPAIRGARTLATVAAIAIGLFGFVDPSRWTIPLHTARLQAFTEAVARLGGPWTAERLAIDRALLLELARPAAAAAAPATRAWRLPVQPDILNVVPDDRPLLVFPAARARLEERERAWVFSIELLYPNAATFLASQPDGTWLALAIRDAGDGTEFCRDLIARFATTANAAARDAAALPAQLAALGRITTGASAADASLTGASRPERLDAAYGDALDRAQAPAKFAIETAPRARIAVNGETNAETMRGAALVAFDPGHMRTEEWLLGAGDETNAPTTLAATARPAIRDERLVAAYLVQGPTRERRPRQPIVIAPPPQESSRPVRVAFGAEGDAWFGAGWNGPESNGEPFRWTHASEAHVRVIVSRRMALRVKLAGSVATLPNLPNALGVSWNDRVIQAPADWPGEREWTIPAAAVRRGANVFTVRVARVVTPGSVIPGADPRPLGAAINRLSFEPIVDRDDDR